MTRAAFSDLPAEVRMAFRAAVDDAGGGIETYSGPYVQVAVPFLKSTAAGLRHVDALANAAGLVRDSDGHFFPLGSDAPAESMRHPMPWKYGDSRSFWYFVSYRPAVAS
jgi:hypothetical protein